MLQNWAVPWPNYTEGLANLGEEGAAASLGRRRPLCLDLFGVVTAGDSSGGMLRDLDVGGVCPGAAAAFCSTVESRRCVGRAFPSCSVFSYPPDEDALSGCLKEVQASKPRLCELVVHLQGDTDLALRLAWVSNSLRHLRALSPC